jgi:hypothetical protein
MKNNNFIYIVMAIAIAAIAVSIGSYIFLSKHQAPAKPASAIPNSVVFQPAAPQPAAVATTATPKTTPKPVGVPAPIVPPVKIVTPPVPQTPAAPPTPAPAVSAPISLPYSVSNFSIKNAWQSIIGSVGLNVIDNGAYKRNLLKISAAANTTVGIAELAGSEDWKNYSFAADINFISGTNFSLIARYRDSKNYTSCTFAQNGVTLINTVIDGKNTTVLRGTNQIATVPYVVGISYKISVDGNDVQCFVNGTPISATIPDMPSSGGIGIEVYNQAPGSSELDIQEVRVSDN